MLDEAEDDEHLQRVAIQTATMAWNLTVMEALGKPGALERALANMTPSAERDELEDELAMLMERKQALFPEDHRIIEDARIHDGPDGPALRVKFSE